MLSAVLQAQKKGRGGRGGGEGGGMKGVGEKNGFRERHRKRIGCIVLCSQHPGHWECLWPVHLPPPHLLLADDNAPIHHNVIE